MFAVFRRGALELAKELECMAARNIEVSQLDTHASSGTRTCSSLLLTLAEAHCWPSAVWTATMNNSADCPTCWVALRSLRMQNANVAGLRAKRIVIAALRSARSTARTGATRRSTASRSRNAHKGHVVLRVESCESEGTDTLFHLLSRPVI
jgi:hypothetical protein